MVDTSQELAVGNFLEWPPSRYLADGYYTDAGKTTMRPELLDEYALKSAFRFLSQGVTTEVAQALTAAFREARGAKSAGRPALQAAISDLAGRLLEEPFRRTLSLYEFFSECAASLRDARDWEALARHVDSVVTRLSLIEAMRVADPDAVTLPGMSD